jgi:hypothetical protein
LGIGKTQIKNPATKPGESREVIGEKTEVEKEKAQSVLAAGLWA